VNRPGNSGDSRRYRPTFAEATTRPRRAVCEIGVQAGAPTSDASADSRDARATWAALLRVRASGVRTARGSRPRQPDLCAVGRSPSASRGLWETQARTNASRRARRQRSPRWGNPRRRSERTCHGSTRRAAGALRRGRTPVPPAMDRISPHVRRVPLGWAARTMGDDQRRLDQNRRSSARSQPRRTRHRSAVSQAMRNGAGLLDLIWRAEQQRGLDSPALHAGWAHRCGGRRRAW